jgi:hypothetical protein
MSGAPQVPHFGPDPSFSPGTRFACPQFRQVSFTASAISGLLYKFTFWNIMEQPSPRKECILPGKFTPFRELTAERQLALREAWAEETARQATTCSLDEKTARFAAWLKPQGISFGAEDLPPRRRPHSAAS